MHFHARPYSASGRGRALAALEEAKRRHAHLGREPVHPDSWPAPPPPASWQEHQQQQQQMRQQGDVHRLTPNLPLAASDAGMLCVGYASRGRQQQRQQQQQNREQGQRRHGEVQHQQEQGEQCDRQPLSLAARCSAAGGGRGLLLGNALACANSLVKQQY